MSNIKGKALKIWNCNATNGKLVVVDHFDDLIMKVKQKFEVGEGLGPIKIVLPDGCQVDDDDGLRQIASDSILYMLREGENLALAANDNRPLASGSSNDQYQRTENLLSLVKRIRGKRTSLHASATVTATQEKKKRRAVKLNLGWMCYKQHKYVQVRTQRGGGTRVVEFVESTDYELVLTKAKELFFPNDVSEEGRYNEFEHSLGDFKGNILNRMTFTVGSYAAKLCLTTRPRVYLLSKPKLVGQDEDSDDDWDLPSLDGILNRTESLIQPTEQHNPTGEQQQTEPSNFIDIIQPTEQHNPTGEQQQTEPSNFIDIIQLTEQHNPTVEQQQTEPSNFIDIIQPTEQHNPTVEQQQTEPSNFIDIIQPTEQHNPTGEQQQIEPSNFIDIIQLTEQHNPTVEQQQTEPSNVMLQGPTDQDSPVTVKMPRMPACGICRDRYCDSFFIPCGHLVCLVCAVELEERHQHCHICRQDIDKISPLYL